MHGHLTSKSVSKKENNLNYVRLDEPHPLSKEFSYQTEDVGTTKLRRVIVYNTDNQFQTHTIIHTSIYSPIFELPPTYTYFFFFRMVLQYTAREYAIQHK